MTSQELLDLLHGFCWRDAEPDYLRESLEQIYRWGIQLRPLVRQTISAHEGSSPSQNGVAKSRKQLDEISDFCRAWKVRQMFQAIEDLRLRLHQSESYSLGQVAEDIERLLTAFAAEYEEFIRTYTEAQTLALIEAGTDLYHALSTFDVAAEYIQKSLKPEQQSADGEAELALKLDSTSDVKTFGAKLVAFAAIYEELCELVGVSVSVHPLKIVKIESGSWWAKVFGDSRVIGLMIGLIESSVRYFHRNYTQEGKIAAIPKSVDAIEALLGLKKSLEKQGIHNPELDHHLSKSSVVIAQRLNELLEDEPHVTLNKTEISVSQTILARTALEGRKNLLADSSPSETES